MATRVSCGAAEMTSSLDMKTPRRASRRAEGVRSGAHPPASVAGGAERPGKTAIRSPRLFQVSPACDAASKFRSLPATAPGISPAGCNRGAGSVDEPPEADVHHQTQRQKHK